MRRSPPILCAYMSTKIQIHSPVSSGGYSRFRPLTPSDHTCGTLSLRRRSFPAWFSGSVYRACVRYHSVSVEFLGDIVPLFPSRLVVVASLPLCTSQLSFARCYYTIFSISATYSVHCTITPSFLVCAPCLVRLVYGVRPRPTVCLPLSCFPFPCLPPLY